MSESSLIPVESVNGIELFTGAGKLDELLAKIRQETATIVPDVSTDKGRKEIASIAYKVARSKTVIDDAGKTLVGEWKTKSAAVRAEGYDWPMGYPVHQWCKTVPVPSGHTEEFGYCDSIYAIVKPGTRGAYPVTICQESAGDRLYEAVSDAMIAARETK